MPRREETLTWESNGTFLFDLSCPVPEPHDKTVAVILSSTTMDGSYICNELHAGSTNKAGCPILAPFSGARVGDHEPRSASFKGSERGPKRFSVWGDEPKDLLLQLGTWRTSLQLAIFRQSECRHSAAPASLKNSTVLLSFPGNRRAYPSGLQSTNSSGRS